MLGVLPCVIFSRVKEALLVDESAVSRNYRFQNAVCFDFKQTPATVLGYLTFICGLFSMLLIIPFKLHNILMR